MKERQPLPCGNSRKSEVTGKVIFDQNGHSVGLAINTGSFDYASEEDLQNTVIIIKPARKENHDSS